MVARLDEAGSKKDVGLPIRALLSTEKQPLRDVSHEDAASRVSPYPLASAPAALPEPPTAAAGFGRHGEVTSGPSTRTRRVAYYCKLPIQHDPRDSHSVIWRTPRHARAQTNTPISWSSSTLVRIVSSENRGFISFTTLARSSLDDTSNLLLT